MRARIPLPPEPTFTLYKVKFTTYDGQLMWLYTTDPGKIGPWLAEMFGLWPYMASSPTSVDIEALDGFRGG